MKTSDRLIRRLCSDLGLNVLSVHQANRGHYREDGVVRWRGKLADGSEIESEDSMARCVSKDCYLTMRRPAQWQDCPQIDANHNRSRAVTSTRGDQK